MRWMVLVASVFGMAMVGCESAAPDPVAPSGPAQAAPAAKATPAPRARDGVARPQHEGDPCVAIGIGPNENGTCEELLEGLTCLQLGPLLGASEGCVPVAATCSPLTECCCVF